MVLPPLLYLEVLMCRLDLLRPLYLVDHLFQKDLEYLGGPLLPDGPVIPDGPLVPLGPSGPVIPDGPDVPDGP